ncbi:hypothetical protein [Solirubrobacter soli]|uniref:hypothetical protein n=1 Tax=Solirubrobacter soli TaxID=363832 RepID=UPI000420DDF5|nr:hypothetical protein [Solirubrobacter soli]
MKWWIGFAVGFLLVFGGFLAVRANETEVYFGPSGTTVSVDSNRWGPWLRNRRWAPVKHGTAAILVHCGKDAICRGSVLIEVKRTGRVLGAGNYDMRPGTDGRIRVRVGQLTKPTKVRLTMREDNGAIGWPEVTLKTTR